MRNIAAWTDHGVIDGLSERVARRARITAEVLTLLIEVERRELHLKRAHGSLFAFCTQALGMSEGSARKHIFVGRKAARFPALLQAIGSGRLHLSGACVIAARLTSENADGLIAEACGKTRRQIEEIVAARFPMPDAAPSLRRLPRRSAERRSRAAERRSPAPPASQPLSADRFKLTVTIDRATWEALQRLSALRRHVHPRGDLAAVVSEAIVERLERVEKTRFGGGRAAKGEAAVVEEAGRAIPAVIRRAVHERDGGRCTYVCPDSGRRCGSDEAIEFHHLDPFAVHRRHEVGRITQRCRAHNQYQARVELGAARIEAARARRGETP